MAVKIVWYRRLEAGASRSQAAYAAGTIVVVGRSEVSDLVLADPSVSRTHARIEIGDNAIWIEDLGSTNGTLIDARREKRALWRVGHPIDIGVFRLELEITAAAPLERAVARAANPDYSVPPTQEPDFPGPFFTAPRVVMAAVRATGWLHEEVDYLTIGGGLGSLAWVQALRIHGVPSEALRIVGAGADAHCHARLARALRAAQGRDGDTLQTESGLPLHWRTPSMGLKEIVTEMSRSDLTAAKAMLNDGRLSGRSELAFGHVFRLLQQEAERIGFLDRRIEGRAVKIRHTDDQRFVVAYLAADRESRSFGRERLVVAKHVHVSLGRPEPGYPPDLALLKRSETVGPRIAHAYEPHDHIYDRLEREGGTVVVRGPGYCIGQILRRLCEARARSSGIRIVYFADLEPSGPQARPGPRRGVNPADAEAAARALVGEDMQWMIAQGLRDGWFAVIPGPAVTRTARDATLLTQNATAAGTAGELVSSVAVIDCSDQPIALGENSLLADLTEVFNLPVPASQCRPGSSQVALAVDVTFEVAAARNGRGRLYLAGTAAGTATPGASEGFDGLRNAALKSVEALTLTDSGTDLAPLGPVELALQWAKYSAGTAP